MQYLITIILIIIPLIVKERKYIRYVQLLWLWMLIGGCYFNVDTPGYMSLFDIIEELNFSLSSEIFFSFMCLVFKALGLSYQHLVMTWAFIFILILDRGIIKLTDRPQIVYSFMFIYPLIENIVQLKNFAAFSVLMYSLHFLLKADVKSLLKFIICICFATIQHSSYIFFFMLLLIPIFRKNKRMEIAYVVLLPVLAMISPLIIDTLGRFIATDAVVDIYVNNYTSLRTLVLLFSWQLANVLLLFYFIKGKYSLKVYSEPKLKYVISEKDRQVVNLSVYVSIFMLITCTLYIVDPIFQRLARNSMVLNGIVLSLLCKYQTNRRQRYGEISLWVFYLAASALIFYVFSGNFGAWESSKIVLENNIFWK